jgi:hypothetical protein
MWRPDLDGASRGSAADLLPTLRAASRSALQTAHQAQAGSGGGGVDVGRRMGASERVRGCVHGHLPASLLHGHTSAQSYA